MTEKNDNYVKLLEIRLKTAEDLIEKIREICKVPPGKSILDYLKPAAAPADKPVARDVRAGKAIDRIERENLKRILSQHGVSVNEKDSSKRLLRMALASVDFSQLDKIDITFLERVASSLQDLK
jgi:hypothetical protein